MKKRKELWTWNRRSVTAALLAALVASTTIIPGFSSGGEIHLINDLGGFWGETSVEAQMERDWNEDIISVAKGAWLDAHAGEDQERHNGGYSATMSSLPDTGIMMATGSDLAMGNAVPADQNAYDIFEDIDEGAASSAVNKYLKKAKKAEKANSGDFLRKMLKDAVIPEDGVPRDNDLKKEILALDKMNDDDYEVFRTDAEYTPAAGDIIFVAGRISTGEDSPASASDAPALLQDLVVDIMATPSEMEQTVDETEVTIVDGGVEEQLILENLEELKKNERTKALKRNAKHAVLAGIIIAGPENTGSDKIHFIYSTDREKVEIGVISRNEVRIIGYADMEQLHDKYCGILEEIEEEAEETEEETTEVIEKVPNEKTEYTWENDVLTVTATLTDPEAIPDDAELVVTPVTRKTEGYNYQAYMDALTGEISSAAEENTILYDVAFLADETDKNGEKTGRRIELQPENDKVRVSFRYSSAALTEEIGARYADKVKVVHLPLAEAAKENTDTTKDATAIAAADITPECLDASIAVGTKSGRIEFQTEGFSVFAITYTVDFHYEVNGKMYEFSIPGGGFVSLEHVVEVLGIARIGENTVDSGENEANEGENALEYGIYNKVEETGVEEIDVNTGSSYEEGISLNNVEVSEAAKKFVADVASVEFSNPELVWVGKVDEATTVGGLKKANGLEVQYSAELTEERITEINGSTVESGDWALISLLPFNTEESLTVTMKNGDQFVVRMTDAQIIANVLTADGERFRITVTYDEDAKIPDGSVLLAREILDGTEEYEKYLGKTSDQWEETQREGFISYARFFDLEIQNNGKKIEPEGPVEVEIDHEDGFTLFKDESLSESLSVIHFAESGTEIIDELYRNENGTEVSYEQNGFSVIGTVAITNANNWPTQNGQYVIVLQNGDEYFAVAQDGTLKRVKYFNDTISFVGSGTTTLDYIDNYLWYYTASGTARGYISTESGNTGNGTFLDPYNSTGLSTTHRQLRTQNNMVYATGYSDGTVHYYTLSASAGEGGKIAQTDLYGDDASQIYYVPYSSFTADDNETGLYTQINVEALIEKWRRQMTRELTVDKTAEVYDYDNRIYRVDIEASSGYYEISPSIALEFVVDCSRSMYFPARLIEKAKYSGYSGLRNWITNNGDTSQVYYFITSQNSAANVFAVYHDGSEWRFADASYYHTQDSTHIGDPGGIYGPLFGNYAGISYGSYAPITLDRLNGQGFSGVLYIAEEQIEGQPWNRLDYLKLAVEAAAKVVYAVDADAQIGLVKFAATATDLGTWGKEDQEEFYTALREISVIGGTNPRDGLDEVIDNYAENSTRQQVVVLVTDGAPNKCTWDEVRNRANILKAQTVAGKKTEIYTLGLSLDNVGTNKQELFSVSSGETFQYDAESGSEIVECITQIVQDVVIQANLKGNVTDVIDSAFYPINKTTGKPLSDGDWITLDGEVVSKGDEDAAGKVVNNEGVWTIEWADQRFDWPTTDENEIITAPGWHGTIFVKAKEDFLGGNGISTNGNGSQIEAVKYIDHSENEVVLTSSEAERIAELETPHVNVDELSFSQNDTEWTVYLGTEVDPLEAVKALYDNIQVYEVVSKTTEDHLIDDEGLLVYEISPDSIIDGRTEENDKEYFSINVIADLTQDQWDQLIGGDTVSIDYSAYGHSSVGTINVSLIQTVVSGEVDLSSSPHVTEKTGTPVETYTLSVSYLPNDSDVSNFHTGIYGTRRPGNDTDDIASENVHKINVFAKDFEILKKDMTNTSKLLDTAKFKLYRTAKKLKDPETGLETVEYEAGAVDLRVGEETKKVVQIGDELATSGGRITVDDLSYASDGTYYLVETEAPAGYNMLTEPIVMHLYLDDVYTHYMTPHGSITREQIADDPYNWTQTINRFVYDSSKEGVVDASKITIEVLNNPGITLPNTGGPGTNLIYIFGIMLTGLAGVGLVMKRRRRNAE